MTIEITTQAQLDKALAKDPNGEFRLVKGKFRLTLTGAVAPWLIVLGAAELHVVARGSSQPHIVARGSSQPHIVARGSSQPHVEAWGSSQPHIVARGSSQPHVEAWESSQPHIVARESSQPHIVARGSSQPHVVAWESSQPHVVAWGSSQPHVVAWGSSQPHVVARESSQPHVEAWESSQPHVVAWGYCQISLRGKVQGSAAPNVSVLSDGSAKIEGGHQIVARRHTAQEWCDYYGVKVVDDIAYVFKGVDDRYRSDHGGDYTPGTVPAVSDWDHGKVECGPGGLHFSPHPEMTREFCSPTKFLICPVALNDIAVHPDGDYPQKIKARGCCAPVVECDRYGEPLAPAEVAA